jgi:hypothetical protein
MSQQVIKSIYCILCFSKQIATFFSSKLLSMLLTIGRFLWRLKPTFACFHASASTQYQLTSPWLMHKENDIAMQSKEVGTLISEWSLRHGFRLEKIYRYSTSYCTFTKQFCGLSEIRILNNSTLCFTRLLCAQCSTHFSFLFLFSYSNIKI